MANLDPSDKERGLYEKFHVERTDGSSEPSGRHYGCRYFVLDLDHDPHARLAILAYALSCEADYPALSSDLLDVLGDDDSHRAYAEMRQALLDAWSK